MTEILINPDTGAETTISISPNIDVHVQRDLCALLGDFFGASRVCNRASIEVEHQINNRDSLYDSLLDAGRVPEDDSEYENVVAHIQHLQQTSVAEWYPEDGI